MSLQDLSQPTPCSGGLIVQNGTGQRSPLHQCLPSWTCRSHDTMQGLAEAEDRLHLAHGSYRPSTHGRFGGLQQNRITVTS